MNQSSENPRTSNCTICNTKNVGNYCVNCGQKIAKKRVSVSSMATDLLTNIFSFEKSILATIISLLKDPRKIIINYTQGHTNYYPSPGKLLVYTLAIAALHVTYINSDILGFRISNNSENPQILFWLTFIPLITLASYFTFIKSQPRFVNHLISVLYLSSLFFIVFTILYDIIYLTIGNVATDFVFPIYLLILFLYNAVIQNKSTRKLTLIFKAIIQLIIFTGMLLLLIGALFLINSAY